MADQKPTRAQREQELRQIRMTHGPAELLEIYRRSGGKDPYIGMMMIQEILNLEYGPSGDQTGTPPGP